MITILGTYLVAHLVGEDYWKNKLCDDQDTQLLAGGIFTVEMLTVGFIGIIYKIHKWLKRS